MHSVSAGLLELSVSRGQYQFTSLLPLTAGSDFMALSESLTFLSGETIGALRCVNVSIVDDEAIEDDEMFSITISSTGAVQALGNTTANITILQDSDSKL